MKAIELIKNEQQFFLEGASQNKKMLSSAKMFNALLAEMNGQIQHLKAFLDDEENGELNNRIIVAKSLAEFFGNNKTLKMDVVVNELKAQEQAALNAFYNIKTRLLTCLKAIIKDSTKEAIVCNFDLFNGEYTKCENGHEILILAGRNIDVLESLSRELDTLLNLNGIFDSIPAQSVDFAADTHNRNIYMCTSKNKELNASKPAKMSKIEAMINQIDAIGQKVVAFYTYKEALADIGCHPKNIKAFENELSKLYIPLKKALQKEFSIEFADICNVEVNESEYAEIDTNQDFVAETYTQNMLGQEYTQTPAPQTFTTEYQEQINTNPFENNQFAPTENYQEPASVESFQQPAYTPAYQEPVATQAYNEPTGYTDNNFFSHTTEENTFEPAPATDNSFIESLTAASQAQTTTQEDNSFFTPNMASEPQFSSFNDSFTAPSSQFEVQQVSEPTSNLEPNNQPFESPFAQSGFTSPLSSQVSPQANEQPTSNPFVTENTTINPFTTESNAFVNNDNSQNNPFLNNSNNPFANRPNPFDQQ